MDSTDETEPTYYGHRPEGSPLPEAWWRVPLRTRQWIAGGVAVVLVCIVAVGVGSVMRSDDGDGATATDSAGAADEPDPVEFVDSLSPTRVATWDDLAECETRSDWAAATGNGFYGGLQFTQTSWINVGGSGSPAEAGRDEQIMRAEALFDLQGWGAWPNCSAQLGLE